MLKRHSDSRGAIAAPGERGRSHFGKGYIIDVTALCHFICDRFGLLIEVTGIGFAQLSSKMVEQLASGRRISGNIGERERLQPCRIANFNLSPFPAVSSLAFHIVKIVP